MYAKDRNNEAKKIIACTNVTIVVSDIKTAEAYVVKALQAVQADSNL